jgi:hypothetical protein
MKGEIILTVKKGLSRKEIDNFIDKIEFIDRNNYIKMIRVI